MEITTRCPWCGKVQIISVDPKAYTRWRSGIMVQYAFPELSPDQREALVSGICPSCWDNTFKEKED